MIVGEEIFDLYAPTGKGKLNPELVAATGDSGMRGGRGSRSWNRSPRVRRESRPSTLISLDRAHLLPAITFIFSRAGCEDAVRQVLLTRITLTTRSEAAAIERYVDEVIALIAPEDAVVLASGVAALAATFTTFLNRGDHAIFSDTTYIAAYRLLNQILPEKYGIETSIVDTSDPANVLNAIKPNTKLIHLETPANPTLKVTDIASVTSIAREAQERLGHDILVSVDNTFNSPYNVRPLELGADIVVESLTKYINGHGDALGGMIATTKARTDEIRFTAQVNYGGIISPFNAWLINRGTVTLPLRMKSAQRLGTGHRRTSRTDRRGTVRQLSGTRITPGTHRGNQPEGPPGGRIRRRTRLRAQYGPRRPQPVRLQAQRHHLGGLART